MTQTKSDAQDLRPHIRTPLTPLAEKARGIGIAFTVGFAASFLELGRMPVVMLVAETIWLAAFIMACLLLLR